MARGQAGALDPTFSRDGKAFLNVTAKADYGLDVAVQSLDGKIVVAGTAGGQGGRIVLLRYNPNGILDPSFGGDGKVFTNLSPKSDWVGGVDVQPDGKIVVAGRSGSQGGTLAVLRYNPDGSLDTSFSGDGKALANFSAGDDFAFGVALQPDGMIVAAGRAGGSGGRMAIVRFDAGGVPDLGFSGDGRFLLNLTPGDDRLDHVVLQPDGKVVAGGTADYFGRQARFAVIRLDTAGARDPAFSGDGLTTTNFTSRFDGIFGIAIQSDGKIVASGQANLSIALARYGTNGALDATFSGDGKVMTNLSPGLDYAEEIEIQVDDKIVVAGTANYYGRNARSAVVRYEASGGLDTSFSSDGKVITDLTAGFDAAFGVALQPDGKIVTTGFASGQGGRFSVLRFLGT
jgi:uncharacterized delta-60 repeat protein